MKKLNKIKPYCFIVLCIFFCYGCNNSNCVKIIKYKDLIGYWKMDNISRNYSVLYFTKDSLISFEFKYFKEPLYPITLDSNYVIINAKGLKEKNKILYIDDSLLLLNSIFDDNEARLYRKFDFNEEKESLKYEDRVP